MSEQAQQSRAPKVFAPFNVVQKEGSYGPFWSISGKAEKIKAFIDAHTTESGFINLTMQDRREVGQYGETHNIILNDWKPKAKADAAY